MGKTNSRMDDWLRVEFSGHRQPIGPGTSSHRGGQSILPSKLGNAQRKRVLLPRLYRLQMIGRSVVSRKFVESWAGEEYDAEQEVQIANSRLWSTRREVELGCGGRD